MPTSPPVTPAAVVWIGNTTDLVVALTFDAGSDAGHTATILDVLAGYGIRATFALTGEWVEQNPQLSRRIVLEGHEVMNHSYDHPSFTGVSSDEVALTTESRSSIAPSTRSARPPGTHRFRTSARHSETRTRRSHVMPARAATSTS
jgi:peptidoglycan/xylan/chitin deacetylase (PgdA/CDA1 family)